MSLKLCNGCGRGFPIFKCKGFHSCAFVNRMVSLGLWSQVFSRGVPHGLWSQVPSLVSGLRSFRRSILVLSLVLPKVLSYLGVPPVLFQGVLNQGHLKPFSKISCLTKSRFVLKYPWDTYVTQFSNSYHVDYLQPISEISSLICLRSQYC